jgi:inosose dehydratase
VTGSLSSRVAAAPISFGVFGSIALDAGADDVLGAIARTGHGGTELGPPGFFGPVDELGTRMTANGLACVGGYVPLHLVADDAEFEADLAGMRRTLAELVATGGGGLAILADEGDAELVARPFRGPEPRLGDADWGRAAARLTAARDLAAASGIGVAVHPHFATHIEKASEIDRLMSTTDLDLCLDTGHLQLGGADPLGYLRRYADRVRHVHLKDIRLGIAEAARRAELRADGDWWNELSCRLGDGDVALAPFLAELISTGYDGWLVIEQDRAPVDTRTWGSALADQEHNTSWLVSAIDEIERRG